jgi:hypothetical protein
MKLNLWLVVLLGVVICGVGGFLISFLFPLIPITRVPVPIIWFVFSHIPEGSVGAFVAGYLSKKHGSIIGVLVAYMYILVLYIFYRLWTLTGTLNNYTDFDLHLHMFLSATVIFFGLIAGALGERASKARNKASSPPTSLST